jgi:ABC-type proline/glycine betaine transport system permease subunit
MILETWLQAQQAHNQAKFPCARVRHHFGAKACMSLWFGIVLALKLGLFLTRSLQLTSWTNENDELHARGCPGMTARG